MIVLLCPYTFFGVTSHAMIFIMRVFCMPTLHGKKCTIHWMYGYEDRLQSSSKNSNMTMTTIMTQISLVILVDFLIYINKFFIYICILIKYVGYEYIYKVFFFAVTRFHWFSLVFHCWLCVITIFIIAEYYLHLSFI